MKATSISTHIFGNPKKRAEGTISRHAKNLARWSDVTATNTSVLAALKVYDAKFNPRGQSVEEATRVLAETGIPVNKLNTASFRDLLQRDRANLGDPSDINKLAPCLVSMEQARMAAEILQALPFVFVGDETTRFNEVFAGVVLYVNPLWTQMYASCRC